MSKVRLESFLWGAGTALGELPPYFMARAARLSGYDPEDAEDLQEFEELQKKRELGEKLNLFEKLKLGMERIVERVGFLGILACASVSTAYPSEVLSRFSSTSPFPDPKSPL
jgi:vacuole membrane protein 1